MSGRASARWRTRRGGGVPGGLATRPVCPLDAILPGARARREGRGKDAGRTMRRTIATHGLLLVVSAIWGGHFVALHFLLQELAPPEVMLIRAILASGFYAVFLLLNRRALPAIQRADWPRLITTGFLGL